MRYCGLIVSVFALLPLGFLLLTQPALAAADHCAVCGARLTERIYSVEDQVTGQKQQFCSECALLRTVCYLCGVPAKTNYTEVSDGRILCARDARTAVLDEEEAKRVCSETRQNLDRLFSRFLNFPETNVTVGVVDRVHLHELFKFAGHDRVCPNIWGYLETRTNRGRLAHNLNLLSALPRAALSATAAHEYTHAWLNENLSPTRKEKLNKDANEGFCEFVSYSLMESQGEEVQKRVIKRNAYTRGQIDLFIEAEQAYGLNDLVDWVKYGTDDRLKAGELRRLRDLEPQRDVLAYTTNAPAYGTNSAIISDVLVLRGIYWTPPRPVALINNRMLTVNEQGRVRVGKTNVNVRCLTITQDAVRIRISDSDEERELRLKSASP
jgi:hypothetical protein